MSQSFVQLNTDGTGKKMDTQTTTTAGQHRQVFVLGDASTDANVGTAYTQPVSLASAPLPTGAATAALQTTGNSSVASVDTKTPALGQTTMAGSSPVAIASDQSSIPVSVADSTAQAYCATSSAFTPGATPQDVFTLTGSGTKTISIRRVYLAGISSTGNVAAFFLRKRSTANSGGTSSIVTAVPRDSNNAAATAVARQYTSNPTAGTLVGDVWAGYISCPSTGVSSAGSGFTVIELAPNNPIILRGTSQVLALNFNGSALPAGTTLLVTFEWVEA